MFVTTHWKYFQNTILTSVSRNIAPFLRIPWQVHVGILHASERSLETSAGLILNWPNVMNLLRITSTQSCYKNCPENKLDRLEEREHFQCEVSSQINLGNSLMFCFSGAKICTRPFCKQQTVPSDCLRLCSRFHMDVWSSPSRNKCTLRTSLVCYEMKWLLQVVF